MLTAILRSLPVAKMMFGTVPTISTRVYCNPVSVYVFSSVWVPEFLCRSLPLQGLKAVDIGGIYNRMCASAQSLTARAHFPLNKKIGQYAGTVEDALRNTAHEVTRWCSHSGFMKIRRSIRLDRLAFQQGGYRQIKFEPLHVM